jgi:hypothetical protein
MDRIAKAIYELQAALKDNGVGEVTDFIFANRADLEALAYIAVRDLNFTRLDEPGRLTQLCGVSLCVAP